MTAVSRAVATAREKFPPVYRPTYGLQIDLFGRASGGRCALYHTFTPASGAMDKSDESDRPRTVARGPQLLLPSRTFIYL
jgi:hypothetical protein